MGTLTLNDGTVLRDSYILLSGSLFVYVQQAGMTIVELFELLCDPVKTAKIAYTQVNGETITFTGYKKLTSVRDEENGLFTAVLKEGEMDVER